MSRRAWRALFGRAVVVSGSFVLFFAVAIFARPVVSDYPKAKVTMTSTDLEGRAVSRAEWIERALAEAPQK